MLKKAYGVGKNELSTMKDYVSSTMPYKELAKMKDNIFTRLTKKSGDKSTGAKTLDGNKKSSDMGEAPSTDLMQAITKAGKSKDRTAFASNMSQPERVEYMTKVVADTNKQLAKSKPGVKLSYDNIGDIDPEDVGRYKQTGHALTQMVGLFPEAFKDTSIRLKPGISFDLPSAEASGLTKVSGLWSPSENVLSSSIGSGPRTALHEVGHLLSSSKMFED